ncbi:hypothetical protein C8F01DRAFT_1236206 [Mycena amicta]|nr:hypothetical protein C8F01DRAFT_1236206 [Mycena amicta]
MADHHDRMPYRDSGTGRLTRHPLAWLAQVSHEPTSLFLSTTMSQDSDAKPSQSHPLPAQYDMMFDARLPISRRLTALGAETGTYGLAYFTIGAASGAIPCAIQAAVNSRRQTNSIPPFQLIRLGALANGVRFGVIGSAVNPALFLIHIAGLFPGPSLNPGRTSVAKDLQVAAVLGGGIAIAMLATWPLQLRIERLWQARGLPVGGVPELAGWGLAAAGSCVFNSWLDTRRSRRVVESEM